MHGWLPAFHNVDPAVIALHKQDRQGPRHDFDAQIRREKREGAQWVSREDQAKYLTRQGYRNVSAIGLPIVYVPPVRVRRVPGSLLVMPPHGHMSHGPGDPIAKAYASAIADIRGRFDQVAVCLSREDLEAQQWADIYRGGGFEVFSAVDPYQPDALSQLKRLLCSFEFVTTNGFGSHIAYAAYCGARVSVFGPFAAMPIERMARTHAVRMFPELLGKAYELCLEAPLPRVFALVEAVRTLISDLTLPVPRDLHAGKFERRLFAAPRGRARVSTRMSASCGACSTSPRAAATCWRAAPWIASACAP